MDFISGNFKIIIFAVLLLTIYMSLNKIWRRRHEPEVVDSISFCAKVFNVILLIAIVISLSYSFDLIFFLLFMSWLITEFFYALVAAGLWARNECSSKDNLKRALRLDRQESFALVKDFLNMSQVEIIYELLCMIAFVDGDFDPAEEKVLRELADEFYLNYDETIERIKSKFGKMGSHLLMQELKEEIQAFIETKPKMPRAELIKYYTIRLITADEKVTPEEEAISAEINTIIDKYLETHKIKTHYHLLAIPQNQEELNSLEQSRSADKLDKAIHGTSNAYHIASFYSLRVAELTRVEYEKFFNCYLSIETY